MSNSPDGVLPGSRLPGRRIVDVAFGVDDRRCLRVGTGRAQTAVGWRLTPDRWHAGYRGGSERHGAGDAEGDGECVGGPHRMISWDILVVLVQGLCRDDRRPGDGPGRSSGPSREGPAAPPGGEAVWCDDRSDGDRREVFDDGVLRRRLMVGAVEAGSAMVSATSISAQRCGPPPLASAFGRKNAHPTQSRCGDVAAPLQPHDQRSVRRAWCRGASSDSSSAAAATADGSPRPWQRSPRRGQGQQLAREPATSSS